MAPFPNSNPNSNRENTIVYLSSILSKEKASFMISKENLYIFYFYRRLRSLEE